MIEEVIAISPFFMVSDLPYFTFNSLKAFSAGLDIICPQCQHHAILKVDESKYIASIKCLHCYYQQSKDLTLYTAKAQGICPTIDKHFNIELHHKKDSENLDCYYKNFSNININCPYCHEQHVAKVHVIEGANYRYTKIIKGHEPYFNCRLYYCDFYQGQAIWALNLEHLNWLIDFIKAPLRHRPPQLCGIKRQSYDLPKFMTQAKNRGRILKILEHMRLKSLHV